jgi:cell division protein FtsA
LGNLNKVLHNAGVKVETYVHSGYATDIAVVNSDEKELGVAIIDIGGSVCNVVVHVNNAICYSNVLSVGSGNITSDISIALHTPLKTAENIKLNYGSLLVNHDENAQSIDIPKIGDENYAQSISLDVVQKIIYARVEETFVLLKKMIEKSNFSDDIGAGIILTGGASKLSGMKELATLVFENAPVRIAKPKEVDGLFDSLRSPAFASAIGLVLYGADRYTKYEIDSNKKIKYKQKDRNNFRANENNFSDLLSDMQEDIVQDRDEELIRTTPIEDNHQIQEKNIRPQSRLTVSKKSDENNLLSRISNSVKHFF